MKKKIALTLRLPIDLYERVKIIAQKEKKFYWLYLWTFRRKNKGRRKKALFEAFSLVAEDTDDVDIAYAFEAQREVIFKNE